jgi:ribosomal protein S18 acetylase RimI-like enzyme
VTGIAIRHLRPEEAEASARLHCDVLDMEFLARCGPKFLAAYHRSWIASPDGMALAALDSEQHLVGVLLGAVDPAAHYRQVLRHGGPALALRLLSRALVHPRLARELATTRSTRYARGLWRIARQALSRRQTPATPPGRTPSPSPAAPTQTAGEITHLMVSPTAQNQGIGRSLLAEAERIGRAAGLTELVLVTPPEIAAQRFYKHLGWRLDGEVVSRSGERFVRFRLPITAAVTPGDEAPSRQPSHPTQIPAGPGA